MIKNFYISSFVDCLVMNAVERKNPTLSDANNTKSTRDLAANIYLSRNQILGNLFAALVVKQNPREHRKVPIKK
jgi:hypothetical protein